MSVTGSASSTNNLKVLKGKISSLSPYAVDPTLSVEGAAAEAKAVGDALEKKIDSTNIADNLTTNDSDKVLSAKQGVTLKKSVDDLRVNTEESIGNMEQTLTNMGVSVKNAQDSAENAVTNAENAVTAADKKIDPDGSIPMTADFNMDSHNIVNLADPIEDTDAANKKFVEDTVKVKAVSATLKASDWYSTTDKAPYLQEIAVEGLTDGVKAKVYAVFAGNGGTDKPRMEACGCVNTAVRGDGEIIFTCFDKRPETDIPVMVELYKGDTEDGECIPMIGFRSGGLSMELLWENASPQSEFAKQTVSLDLSEYDMVEISFNLQTGVLAISHQLQCKVDEGRVIAATPGTTKYARRSTNVSKTGINFGDCSSYSSSNDTTTTNGSLIPVYVYGIKGVSV